MALKGKRSYENVVLQNIYACMHMHKGKKEKNIWAALKEKEELLKKKVALQLIETGLFLVIHMKLLSTILYLLRPCLHLETNKT